MKAGTRVLIDTAGGRGGSFTYLVNILPRICALAPDTQFGALIRNDRLREALPSLSNLERIELRDTGIARRLFHTFFELPRFVRGWRADLFFSVGEVAPLRLSCPSIASFRNSNVFTDAVYFPRRRDRARLRVLGWIAARVAKRCDKIMFVSEDSARWIGDALGLPAEKRAVIPHGIDADAWAGAAPSSNDGRPYILSVSSVYRYKNFVRLIEAYTQVVRRNHDAPDLVIIGDDQDPPFSADMRAAREAAGEFASRIQILGEVPYSEVKNHYAGACLFVFPSYLESFGHPLLEAMVSRVPLVASELPVFHEIAADAALYADPFDVSAIAHAIEEALRPDIAQALVARGEARLRHYSWDRTAERLLELFTAVMDEH